MGDVNGDGRADFAISVNAASLTAGDFLLYFAAPGTFCQALRFSRQARDPSMRR